MWVRWPVQLRCVAVALLLAAVRAAPAGAAASEGRPLLLPGHHGSAEGAVVGLAGRRQPLGLGALERDVDQLIHRSFRPVVTLRLGNPRKLGPHGRAQAVDGGGGEGRDGLVLGSGGEQAADQLGSEGPLRDPFALMNSMFEGLARMMDGDISPGALSGSRVGSLLLDANGDTVTTQRTVSIDAEGHRHERVTTTTRHPDGSSETVQTQEDEGAEAKSATVEAQRAGSFVPVFTSATLLLIVLVCLGLALALRRPRARRVLRRMLIRSLREPE